LTSLRQTWIEQGRARLLPLRVSLEFREYVNSLPWMASTLDWSRLQYTKINISKASCDELLTWAKSSSLGRHSHLVLFFSPAEQCLLVSLDDGISHIDELFWESPGVNFCFGADVSGDTVTTCFTDLLQYGAGDLLFATTRLQLIVTKPPNSHAKKEENHH